MGKYAWENAQFIAKSWLNGKIHWENPQFAAIS
jgi:hypothetical protein